MNLIARKDFYEIETGEQYLTRLKKYKVENQQKSLMYIKDDCGEEHIFDIHNIEDFFYTSEEEMLLEEAIAFMDLLKNNKEHIPGEVESTLNDMCCIYTKLKEELH